MTDFILAHYAAFKGIHLLFAFIWSAALVVLCANLMGLPPRFNNPQVARNILRKRIILPFMILSVVLGVLFLMANPAVMSGQGWMHAKFTLLFFLFGVHGFLVGQTKKAALGVDLAKPFVFRIILTFSVILPVIIIGLALIKPF